MALTPKEILNAFLNKQVLIILNDADYTEITGKLISFDDFVNLVLDEAQITKTRDETKQTISMPSLWLSGYSIAVITLNE